MPLSLLRPAGLEKNKGVRLPSGSLDAFVPFTDRPGKARLCAGDPLVHFQIA
jgi:hypothetical protein